MMVVRVCFVGAAMALVWLVVERDEPAVAYLEFAVFLHEAYFGLSVDHN